MQGNFEAKDPSLIILQNHDLEMHRYILQAIQKDVFF